MLPGIKKLFGLKTVPFSNERSRLEPFAEKRIKPNAPEVIEPLMRAVDAFDAVQNTGKLLPTQLDALIAAVSSSRRPLYLNICGYVSILSRKWPEVRTAILEMARDKQSHIRFNAVLCLDQSAPPEFVEGILRAALLDKSAKVRQKAADWMSRLNNKNLLSELAAATAVETNEPTRRTMIYALGLLRDGYLLSPLGSERFSLTVPTDDGGSKACFVDQRRIDEEGIEKLVAELRKETLKP